MCARKFTSTLSKQVYTYSLLYIYIQIHMHVRTLQHAYVWTCVCTSKFVCRRCFCSRHVLIHVNIRVYLYICVYGCMHVCMYTHIHICICIYVYMYICIYVYMYICIYVYMYGSPPPLIHVFWPLQPTQAEFPQHLMRNQIAGFRDIFLLSAVPGGGPP